jgi:hypothetical protein
MIALLTACGGSLESIEGADVIAPLGSSEPNDTGTGGGGAGGAGGGDETDDGTLQDEEVEPPEILINEVQSNNASTWAGTSGLFPDWIEIYNASSETVTYDRLMLVDQSGVPWMGDTADELAPGGFLVVEADGSTEGGLHAPFELDADGDTLVLSVDGYVTDRLALGQLDDDVAWARYPDGGEWSPTVTCSPGAGNSEPSESLDASEAIWDLTDFITLNFTGSNADIQALASTYSSYQYTEIALEIDGVEYDPVGAKIRGSSTRKTWGSKPSLNIKIDKYEDFEYRNNDGFKILNMVWYSDYIKEYVGYNMFRDMGVGSPRTSYAFMRANGELQGFYLLTQYYDRKFMKDFFGTKEGYIWEANGDFTSYTSWDCEVGNPCDTTSLAAVKDLLSDSPTDANVARMETYVALDNFLREYAVECAIGQWDGYTSPHNFRVMYNGDDGLLYFLPSSIDLTFSSNYGYYYGNGALFKWCRRNDACAERYDQALLDLADTIDGTDWDGRLDDVKAAISDHWGRDQDDPQSTTNSSSASTAFETIRSYVLALPDKLRDAVN